MGTNSFTVMWTSFYSSGHEHWNHSPVHEKAPPPQLPDVSDVMVTSGGLRTTGDNRLTPFQPERNTDHHSRSERKPLLRRMKWCNSLAVIDRSIIHRKNDRAGFTTRHACWSCPISANKSRFLQDFLSLHWSIFFCQPFQMLGWQPQLHRHSIDQYS